MPDPIETQRFNHAALNTRDVSRAVAFYCEILGFHEVPRPSFSFAGSWLYRNGLGMVLHLIHDADLSPPRDRIESRKNHLAFRADVDIARERLREHDIQFIERVLPDHGYRQLFFHDPDGNVIELGEWPDVS
jgi:catechol 2,3-dioxygenase-like lactoylglutathione lyase family enzyme